MMTMPANAWFIYILVLFPVLSTSQSQTTTTTATQPHLEPVEYNVYESRETAAGQLAIPRAASKEKNQREEIMEIIFKNYRTHERPTEKINESTVVYMNMKILAVFSVDVRNMDYYVDALLRQRWTDPRLAWDKIPKYANYTIPIVSPKLKEQLWLPDLFFRNGKDGYLHKMTLPNYLLRVYPDGGVLYSQKITMRFACQMDLQLFPMDEQICDINIGSYGYTLQELRFAWTETKAVELADDLQLSEFNTPATFETIDCSAQASTKTGNYTCLLATFQLSRQLSSYLVTTYIPNILIIMVSWVGFWVSVDAAPARVPLGLLCLQGLSTQAVSISSSLPRVSYIKAIDLWLISSIIFVVSVMAEYAVALTIMKRERQASWKQGVRKIVREELAHWWTAVYLQLGSASSTGGGTLQNPSPVVTKQQADVFAQVDAVLTYQGDLQPSSRSKLVMGEAESIVDRHSRVIFPVVYLIFNACYWIYYLVIQKPSQ